MIEDPKCDEIVRKRVRGKRGARYFFLGNIYMPPESKSTVRVEEIQNKFEDIAVDLQKYRRQGEVVLVGGFTSRIGRKASNPNENIGQHGKVTNNKNGTDMLEFLKSNEMKTLNDRVCAAGVVTKTTDRDSSRYTYNGTRRVRQLALGCESN